MVKSGVNPEPNMLSDINKMGNNSINNIQTVSSQHLDTLTGGRRQLPQHPDFIQQIFLLNVINFRQIVRSWRLEHDTARLRLFLIVVSI